MVRSWYFLDGFNIRNFKLAIVEKDCFALLNFQWIKSAFSANNNNLADCIFLSKKLLFDKFRIQNASVLFKQTVFIFLVLELNISEFKWRYTRFFFEKIDEIRSAVEACFIGYILNWIVRFLEHFFCLIKTHGKEIIIWWKACCLLKYSWITDSW